jgi:hypothetical protein
MSRLGNYLQKQGLITRDQLEEALEHRAEHGARLGTNLVELRMLRIEQLAEYLSMFHSVPLPPRRWLERPQRAAVQRVSRPLVERVRFVPMRLDGNILHAAVMDPRDPRVLDDLRFAIGCRIEPYVLPEIWMHDWLLALFKVPRGIREVDTAVAEPAESDAVGQTYDFQAMHLAQTAQAVASVQRPPAVPSAAQAQSPPKRVATVPDFPVAAAPVPMPVVPAFARAATPAHGPAIPEFARAAAAAHVPAVPEFAGAGAAAHERASAPLAASLVQAKAASVESSIGEPVRAPAMTVRSLGELAAAVARPSFETDQSTPRDRETEISSFWQRKPAFDDRWLGEARESEAAPAIGEPERTAPAQSEPAKAPAHSTRAPAAEALGHMESALLHVSERERLIELSLAIASRFASTLALFVVQRGMLQGLRCEHGGAPHAIDGVLVPIESVSMLTDAVNAGKPVLVDPRAHAIDQRVLQLIGDDETSEAGLFPVSVKQRVVNVLYASNGREPLGAIAFAALGALAQQMGPAYEQLILHRKTAGGAGRP